MIRSTALVMSLAMLSTMALAQAGHNDIGYASEVINRVQINQGEKFLPLHKGKEFRVFEGDKVMAMSASRAKITFGDGCDLWVEEETIIVIPDKSTCAGGIVLAQSTLPATSGAVTIGAGAGWRQFWELVGVACLVRCFDGGENPDDTVSP